MAEFDAIVAVVRAWSNGAIDLDLRAVGGPDDGLERSVRLEGGDGTPLLTELSRLLAGAS